MIARLATFCIVKIVGADPIARNDLILILFFGYFLLSFTGVVLGLIGLVLPFGQTEAIIYTAASCLLVFWDTRLNPGVYSKLFEVYWQIVRYGFGLIPKDTQDSVPTLAPLSNSPDHPEVKKFSGYLKATGPVADAIVDIFRSQYTPQNEDFNAWNTANKVNSLFEYYPPLTLDPNGKLLSEYFAPDKDFPWFSEAIGKLRVRFTLEPSLRCEHTHILANTGHGKSELFKQLIAGDLGTNASIIVMDSQGDIIRDLVPHIHPDRLVLIDPETCPVPVRIFQGEGSSNLEKLVEMFEYILGALELNLTAKMTTVFRYVCMLVLRIPGGNLNTMYDIIKTGPGRYHQQLEQLDDTAQQFFRTDFDTKLFKDTREDIAGRMYGLLSSEPLRKMLAPNGPTLDVASAIDSGKVLLVNTNKAFVSEKYASLLGRLFLVLIMQAAFSRQGVRHRTYLYIDEFKDYAQDGPVLRNLFVQARKYEVGLHIAHQNLAQLGGGELMSSVMGSAMKLTGSLVAADAAKMASEMRAEKDELDSVHKLEFRYHQRGMNTRKLWVNSATKLWRVDTNALRSLPRYQTVEQAQEAMRQRFGKRVAPATTVVATPAPQPASVPLTNVGVSATTEYSYELLAEVRRLYGDQSVTTPEATTKATKPAQPPVTPRKPTQYDEDSDEWPE